MRKFIVILLMVVCVVCNAQLTKGFQSVGVTIYTHNASQMFEGFPSNIAASTPNPFIIMDGLVAWWNSQNGVTLNGSTVSAWVDQIGGYTFIQNTAINQPTYTSADGIFRNYPSIGGNAGSSTMSAGNVLNIGTDAGRTIFFIGKAASLNNTIIYKANSPAFNAITDAGGYNIYSGTFSTGSFSSAFYDTLSVKSAINATSNNPGIYCMKIDRTLGTITGTGSLTTVTTSTVVQNTNSRTNTDNLIINTNNITFLEVLVYNRALTQVEISQNITNLRAKYGI